ncbi:MAG TPA: glycosyltransferase [Acidimicrobiia bacterium]|jgi:glycosyltransferase involved in cell wall biosynthesis
MTDPLVTIVIPVRDDARHLPGCLAAVAAQDHPHARLEVIVVVDGATGDDSAIVAYDLLRSSQYQRALVLVNADGGTPKNLNMGLAAARGSVLCRVDARSLIPPDYVRRCAELVTTRRDLAVVGGAQVAVAPRHDAIGRGIARALNNRWGMGGSRYRRGAGSGPADTVYLGAFRTRDLRSVGGWDAALTTNQDFDLNRRLGRRGAVWFEAGLPVGYVPRSTVRDLYRQYRRFGRWKVRYWRHTHDHPRPRQLALLVGVPLSVVAAAVVLVLMPPVGQAVLVFAVVAAAATVELAGSRRPTGGPAVHGWSALALGAVGMGWLGGAWAELLHRKGGRGA